MSGQGSEGRQGPREEQWRGLGGRGGIGCSYTTVNAVKELFNFQRAISESRAPLNFPALDTLADVGVRTTEIRK